MAKRPAAARSRWITAHRPADLDSLCLVDDYRLMRADEVALRASVVQIWPV
jgi:hypothetical protein